MRIYSLLILLCAILTISCQTELPVAETIDQRIEQIVKANLIMGAAPGYAVGIIKNGQKLFYFNGVQNLNTGKPFDKNTIGEVASITKTFTALLFADLVSDGIISLDDSVNKYMPRNLRLPSKNGVPIKIIHLLNHTSGLPRLPDDLPIDINRIESTYGSYSEIQMSAYLKRVVLESTPGTKFLYSNLAMGIAGFLIKQITGKSYQVNIKEKITQPLGMQASFVDNTDAPTSNVAQGYMASKAVSFFEKSEFFEGDGSVKSNVNDMLLYLDAFIGNSPTNVLNKAFDRVKQPTFKDDKIEVGLNWIIYRNDTKTPTYWHNGGSAGFSSFIAYDDSKKVGVFVLCNSFTLSANTDTIGMTILKELAKD